MTKYTKKGSAISKTGKPKIIKGKMTADKAVTCDIVPSRVETRTVATQTDLCRFCYSAWCDLMEEHRRIMEETYDSAFFDQFCPTDDDSRSL